MRFITKSESEAYFAKLGIEGRGLVPGSRSAVRLKTFDIYYRSPFAAAREVAHALAVHQGDFSACLLWACGLIFGDRSLEAAPPPGWSDYRHWREAHGESRSLYEAPGHVFDAGEGEMLSRIIALAIVMGWDALVAAKPGKFTIHLSHDDRISIYARSQPSGLFGALSPLGLEAKRRGLR
jgi:hypothetical protein